MTVARMLIAAVCALAAGIAVENAKATASCKDVGAAVSCGVAPGAQVALPALR